MYINPFVVKARKAIKDSVDNGGLVSRKSGTGDQKIVSYKFAKRKYAAPILRTLEIDANSTPAKNTKTGEIKKGLGGKVLLALAKSEPKNARGALATIASRLENEEKIDDALTEEGLHNTLDYWIKLHSEEGNPFLMDSFHDEFAAADVKPEHIVPAVATALTFAEKELEALPASYDGQTPIMDLIKGYVKASDYVNRAFTPMSNLNTIKSSAAFKEQYRIASPLVKSFSLDLFNKKYKLVKDFLSTDREARLSSLKAHERNMLLDIEANGFLSGAELSPDDFANFKQFQETMEETSLRAGMNLVEAAKRAYYQVTDREQLRGLDDATIKAAEKSCETLKAKLASIEEKENAGDTLSAEDKAFLWVKDIGLKAETKYLINAADRFLVEAIFASADDEGLREGIFKMRLALVDHGEFSNKKLLSDLMTKREEAVKLINPEWTPADLLLHNKMAKTPRAALDFCIKTYEGMKDKLEADTEIFLGESGKKLKGWNKLYKITKAREKVLGMKVNELKPYLQFDNVLEKGILQLSSKAFEINFEEVKNPGNRIWDSHVKLYKVMNKAGKEIAELFVDPYERDDKRATAYMMQLTPGHTDAKGKRVKPRVVIGLNFTPPQDGKPAVINAEEAWVVGHEKGHALHGLLSQTEFASQHGTNVKRDYVEVPSHTHEELIYKKELMKKYMIDPKTGKPVSDELIDKFIESRKVGASFHMPRIYVYSIFDLLLHMKENVDGTSMKDYSVESIEKLWKDVDEKYGELDPEGREGFPWGFQHIFSDQYAAGYFGYLWSMGLARENFAEFEDKDDPSKIDWSVGPRYRDTVLASGAQFNPWALQDAFINNAPIDKDLIPKEGRMPNVDAMVKYYSN